MRIFFDTNVLFSAFISTGTCAELYRECLQRAQIVVSPFVFDELKEKLMQKANLSPTEAQEVIRAIRADSELVQPRPLVTPVCRDKADDMILAAALEARVDAIVSGDDDLLVLRQFCGIPILTPRECLRRMAE